MRRVILSLFLIISGVSAKVWYTIDFSHNKCIKHAYSPYDYKKALGGTVESSDGLFVFHGQRKTMFFTNTLKLCNTVKNNINHTKK